MARNVNEQIIDHRSASAKPGLRKVKGIYKHEAAVSTAGDDLADRRSYLGGVKAETRYYERAPAEKGGEFRLSRREETRVIGRDRITDYGPGKSETVQKFRSNGERAKVTERGEDGISKKVRRYDASGELKRAYETSKSGERTLTFVKRLGYTMALSAPNVEGDRTLEKSFGKILSRRYVVDAEGNRTQIGRRNFMSSKSTTLGELGDPDIVKVKHFNGLINKTYEREGSDDTVSGITKTELGRRIGFYRRKFERDLDNDTETRTRQLGKTGRLFKVEETRREGSDDVIIKKQALFGLLQSKKTVSMPTKSEEAAVTFASQSVNALSSRTLAPEKRRPGRSSLEAKLDARVNDRQRSLSR